MKFSTICLLLFTMMIATACGSDQRLKKPCTPGLFSFSPMTSDCGPLRPVNEAIAALFGF